MRVAIVMGTRPHVPKVAPVRAALIRAGAEVHVLHTNQHHDAAMHERLFAELGYEPDAVLPDYRFGAAVDWVSDRLRELHADYVLLQGDSAPALVGATAALYAGVRIGHVEAGLRSNDHRMLEEANRVMVDAVADDLFSYCIEHAANLAATPFVRGTAQVVGNPTVDLIRSLGERIAAQVLPAGRLMFVTLHRRELTDAPHELRQVLRTIGATARAHGLDVVFPVHPRTAGVLGSAGLDADRELGQRGSTAPLGLVETLSCTKHAAVVVTDSGCLQEEACILGTPCVTVRPTTERPETLACGANVVVGTNPEAIAAGVAAALDGPREWAHPYGDGGAAARIAAAIVA